MEEKSEAYRTGYAAGYEGKGLPAQYAWGGVDYNHGVGIDYRNGHYRGVNTKAEEKRKAKPMPRDTLAWLEINKPRMTVRLANCITAEIEYSKPTLLELFAYTDAEWLRHPNFGRKSLHELREIIPWGSTAELDPVDVQVEVARLRHLSKRLEANAKMLQKCADAMQAAIDGISNHDDLAQPAN